jgi:hypothetical protein
MVASIVEHSHPITSLDEVTNRCKVRGEPYHTRQSEGHEIMVRPAGANYRYELEGSYLC